MDGTISGELNYWIGQANTWPCYCGGAGAPAPVQLCNRCRIATALDAADDYVASGDHHHAALSLESAARHDARFDPLVSRLHGLACFDVEPYAHDPAPYEHMELAIGTGPWPGAVDPFADTVAVAPPEAAFPCGCTSSEHEEIKRDAERRDLEFIPIGDTHEPDLGEHLRWAFHACCGSTVAWPIDAQEVEDTAVQP